MEIVQNHTANIDVSHPEPKKTPCGADAIILLWVEYKEHEKKMDYLLVRALNILASTSEFPERVSLVTTINELRALLGFFS